MLAPHGAPALCRLLADQPGEATAAFEQALVLAQRHAPYQAAHMHLMLSESRRRTGDHAGANREWAQGATAAAEMLGAANPVADPTFWERAMYLQPVGVSWPPTVAHGVARMATRGPSVARSVDIERIVQSFPAQHPQAAFVYVSVCLSSWRMERGDCQGALVTLKRAEAATEGDAEGWLRIAQARAFAGLQQGPTATTLLMQLVGQEPVDMASPVTRAALADLGSLRLRDGDVRQGSGLLRRAVATEPKIEWPGRGNAEADFALALLMLGDETEGLAWLGRAQRRFESAGEVEMLAKSLWNESRYYEEKKDKKGVAVAQQRLDVLQL